jgi:hypothetical protein
MQASKLPPRTDPLAREWDGTGGRRFSRTLFLVTSMLSIQEWRELLGRKDLTDEEVAEFVQDLQNFAGQFLDEYFRDEFEPDEV